MTYSLHNIFESIETNVASGGGDLGIHGHSKTLTDGRKDQRPLSANKRKLNRQHGNDGTENTRGIDGNVMDVGRSDRTRRSDFVAEKNQRQELASQVERPVITHVGDCQKNENEHLQLVGEESFKMFEAVRSIAKDALESLRCAEGLTGGCELVV